MKQIPKYMEIYLDVKRKIMDDKYQVGTKLPTGDQLAEEYGTSKLNRTSKPNRPGKQVEAVQHTGDQNAVEETKNEQ
ncbi:hypothetical protein K4E_15510 [Enterococcus thailandicus]|nr:hypothetical protein K4E_15510 [Enterococcus thailandicus]